MECLSASLINDCMYLHRFYINTKISFICEKLFYIIMQNQTLWIMFPNLRDCGEMRGFLYLPFLNSVWFVLVGCFTEFFFVCLFHVKVYQFLVLYFVFVKATKSGSLNVYNHLFSLSKIELLMVV